MDLDVLGPLDTGLQAVSAGDHVSLGAGGQLAPQGPRLLKLEQLLPNVLTSGHIIIIIIVPVHCYLDRLVDLGLVHIIQDHTEALTGEDHGPALANEPRAHNTNFLIFIVSHV